MWDIILLVYAWYIIPFLSVIETKTITSLKHTAEFETQINIKLSKRYVKGLEFWLHK